MFTRRCATNMACGPISVDGGAGRSMSPSDAFSSSSSVGSSVVYTKLEKGNLKTKASVFKVLLLHWCLKIIFS